MQQLPYEKIIELIQTNADIPLEEVEKKVLQKMDEFSGLISQDGAAHIVANELGVNLVEEMQSPKKVKELQSGMRDITILLKVVRKYDVITFNRDGNVGTVASALVGDETGTTRLTFWHSDVDIFKQFEDGDIVEFKGLTARENQGRVELTYSGTSSYEGKDVELDVSTTQNVQSSPAENKKIKDITESDGNISLLATVVQLYKPTFYTIDKETRRRVRLGPDEQFDPQKHDHACVLNAVLDDGTETIRSVFFTEQCLLLLGVQKDELYAQKDNDAYFSELKTKVLGKYIRVTARSTKNQLFDRVELICNFIDVDPDPKKEMERL